MLIDTHSHLNFSAFKDDADETIVRALAKDIWLINVGTQSTTCERAVRMAEKYERGVYAAVGLHPTHLFETLVDESEFDVKFKSRSETWDADFYEKLAASEKVVAIGEIGLDYNFAPQNIDLEMVKAEQKKVFRQALDCADRLNLPVIIHSRDTHDDIVPILKEYLDAGRLARRGVLHCFTGGWSDAERYLDLGFLISFTGIITFAPRPKQMELQRQILEVVEKIPLDKIMVETDSPYLTPEPHRGERNEPQYVEFVARKIAQIKNIPFGEVASATTATAKKFFEI
jgi:TatD DNase family protein